MYPRTHRRNFCLLPACEARGTRGCTCLFGGQEGACPCPLPRLHAEQPSDVTRPPQSLWGGATCKMPVTCCHGNLRSIAWQETFAPGTVLCQTDDTGMRRAQTLTHAMHAAVSARQSRAPGVAPGSPLHHDKGLDAPALQFVPAGQAEQAPPAHGAKSAHASRQRADAAQDQPDDHPCLFLHRC